MPSAAKFQAVLERMESRLNWVIVRIPQSVSKRWGKRGRIPVAGEINGFPFRTSLFPSRAGGHFLLVNKLMQVEGKARPGARAQFRLEIDTHERTVTVPAELNRVLNEDKSLRRWFAKLNYSTRKYISDWISQVKSLEARTRRAEQIGERLMATMEAERELPPILQRAFAANPKAHEGWERMSVAHRRAHLMAIFYYRTPEARERRIAKMMEEAAGK